MSGFNTFKESEEDTSRVDQVLEHLENTSGDDAYHIRLKPNEEKDLYFIDWRDIAVLWKKFPGNKQPPIIKTEAPTEDEAEGFKQTIVFKIYDPNENKEGFIEFTAISTARDILEYLRGNPDKNKVKTNFLNIFRTGEGKATRYAVRPAK